MATVRPVNLFCRGGFFIVALRAASARVRTSTDNTNQMNRSKLAAIAALIAAQGITPTAEMVIGLAVRTLVESGQDPRTAFDTVMGAGSFQQLADDLFAEMNA